MPDRFHTADPVPFGPQNPDPEPVDVRVHDAPRSLAEVPLNASVTATPLATAAANVVAFVIVLVMLAKFADFCATATASNRPKKPNCAGRKRDAAWGGQGARAHGLRGAWSPRSASRAGGLRAR